MIDVLIVSIGSTAGLRAADKQLAESLRRADQTVEIAAAQPPRELRTLALTDLAWALACRRAARKAIAQHNPRAIIYSSTTAALFWPRRGAIRFDATAAGNRPGRHGFWQRPLERRRLKQAPLLLPWSSGALEEGSLWTGRSIVLPVAVELSDPGNSARDITAITYAANAHKKGLDRVLEAWATARREGEQLIVVGADRHAPVEGVEYRNLLDNDEYRSLLCRARLYVTAPRREDYGIAQLEALASGCLLVTNRAPGPYAALPLAEKLDARLVGEDLAAAIRSALDDPPTDYVQRARSALGPFTQAAIDQVVQAEVIPRLFT